MRLPEEYEEQPKLSPMIKSAILIASSLIVIIVFLVIILNESNKADKIVETEQDGEDILVENDDSQSLDEFVGGILKPEDLDFWDMYPEKEETKDEDEATENEKTDPATDGKHTLIVNENGQEEWVLISPYLPKHSYDYNNLRKQNGIYKYYDNGRAKSYSGVEISADQGKVDFEKLKDEGIEFVMLHVGSRGYATGEIIEDKYFADNLKNAAEEHLMIGIIFSSQAITTAEIKEEVAFVLDKIGTYTIDYPVAINISDVGNDEARTDDLSRDEKTELTKLFADMVEVEGYHSIILGAKEQLIQGLDLTALVDQDICLYQNQVLPDYPYQFTMWSYVNSELLDGVTGYTTCITSFVDYSRK